MDKILDRLMRLHPRLIDLSLDRVTWLLARLGNPHLALPPVIHVAGTNGKGSTIAFLRAMLEAAGHRVHVYTSPHLVRFNERIRLAGRLITDHDLSRFLEACENANDGAELTLFEIVTAAAFLAFAEVPADVVLLETGLGGRLDATNVIPAPAVTAITRISFDHMQFLGTTLVAIATEKAGIIKPGVPVVVAPQPDDQVERVLLAAASAARAPVALAGRDWAVSPAADGGFLYQDGGKSLSLPQPALAGQHQLINAGTAIACLAPAGLSVDLAAIRAGLARVDWPGRLQALTNGRLPSLLPDGWELWLDGAHNDSGGEAVAAQAELWARQDNRPLDVIFGGLATREPQDVLRPLARWTRRLLALTIPDTPNALAADAIASAARSVGIRKADAATGIVSALRTLAVVADDEAAGGGAMAQRRVLICGSLYLAGAVLAANDAAGVV